MDLSKLILEDAIQEIGLGTSAIIGAGTGAIVNTALWARKRLALRKKLQDCGRDYTCRATVQDEINNLNKGMMKKTAIAAGAGAGAGAVAKTGVINSLNKMAAVSAPVLQTTMAVGNVGALVNQAKSAAATDVNNARQDVLDAESDLNQVQAKASENIERAQEKEEDEEKKKKDREKGIKARRDYLRSGGDYA